MKYTELSLHQGLPYSERFDDVYFSAPGTSAEADTAGEGEFEHVFFAANALAQRWRQQPGDFVIAELGFGSGLNCMLSIRKWLSHLEQSDRQDSLHYIAIEKFPLSPEAIHTLYKERNELSDIRRQLLADYPLPVEAVHSRRLFAGRVVVHFMFMDVLDALDANGLNVDCWYLDGFAPAKNSQMWLLEVFAGMAKNSRPGTTCSTYSAAGMVRRNLQAAGFEVTKIRGYANKREMISACFPGGNSDSKENHALHYRDRPWFSLPKKPEVNEKKACIIGAGIAGLAAAYALVQRGWKVELLDKNGRACTQTSSNPGVVVYPRLSVDNDSDNRFYISAWVHALYLFNKLQKQSGEKFWFEHGLQHYLDLTRAEKIIKRYRLGPEVISIARTLDNGQAIVEYPHAGLLLPPLLCNALLSACGEQLTLVDANISTVERKGSSWHCLSGDEVVSRAQVIIVAGGAELNRQAYPWSENLFPLQVIPGQLAVLAENKRSRQMKKTVNKNVHISPPINGRHYLGASYRQEEDMAMLLDSDRKKLLAGLEEIFPGMFSEVDYIEGWVGRRTVARDRVPLAGAVADEAFFNEAYADIRHGNTRKPYPAAQYLPGLYISAAHGSRGFTSSFLAGEIIAAMICGEPLVTGKKVLDYLSPSRFLVHNLQHR